MPREKSFDSEPDDEAFAYQVGAARRNRELIDWLARWRNNHEQSQAEVATRMHTSQPAVARLESHQHDAQLSTLARYVTALGLSLKFVLTDNETGAEVWTSREGLDDEVDDAFDPEEDSQAANTPGMEVVKYELPDITVVNGTWVKVSESDVERDLPVLAESAEPGWAVLYSGTHSSRAIESVTSAVRHTLPAEDPTVLGMFGDDDPDPISIAYTTSRTGAHTRQTLFLFAKFRDADLAGFTAEPRFAELSAMTALLTYSLPHRTLREYVRRWWHASSADARIGIEAPNPDTQYASLKAWLSTEPGLDIHVIESPRVGARGRVIDALIVLIGSGVATLTFPTALSSWLVRHLTSDMKIQISVRGHSIQLDADQVEDAEPLVRELLSTPTEETSPDTPPQDSHNST